MPTLLEQRLGIMPTQKLHSELCKCNMCMKSRLPTELANQHEHRLKATMVDRRNPDAPLRPLMKATIAHAIINTGTSVDMMKATGLTLMDLPNNNSTIYLTQPQEITIKGTWKNRSVEKALSGRDASVFGGLGVLLVPPDFSYINIPKMNALAVDPAFLKKYGAELIPLEQPVTLEAVNEPELENLYLVQYDFDKDYIDQYVMKMSGGGGLFVEIHPFPHVFTPLSEHSGGALILGKALGKREFTFASFEIPYGYTMKIDSNVIHGDSFFVGPYAIALTDTELADSVIFRQETTNRDIQKVKQTPSPLIRLPILAEYRLAKAVNHQMMIEKLRHEGQEAGLELAFFQKLPMEILENVQDVLPLALTAIKERTSSIELIEKTDKTRIQFFKSQPQQIKETQPHLEQLADKNHSTLDLKKR